jgi:hypothetical protein
LLTLTFLLNFTATFIRSRLRRKMNWKRELFGSCLLTQMKPRLDWLKMIWGNIAGFYCNHFLSFLSVQSVSKMTWAGIPDE